MLNAILLTQNLRLLLLGGLVTLTLSACASQRVEHPMEAVTAYCRAVDKRAGQEVYELLDEDARMGMDRDAFLAWFERNYESIKEQSDELSRKAHKKDMDVKASVPVVSDKDAQVVWREGGWFLAEQAPTRSTWSSPRETLAALREALHEQDLEELMRLLSQERREAFLRELTVLEDKLQDSDAEAIVAHGDSADLILENGDRLRLVREGGLWKVQAYEPASR